VRARTHGENLLYELAQALAAGNDHSTAIALRKLVQAGYTTLQQVDGIPDYIILAIPGMGVKRLGAIRRLTRPDWQPPSPQAIQITGWYLTAVRFALRFWPADTLDSVIRGSRPKSGARGPAEMRLAMDVFARAAHDALAYCDTQELLRLLQEVGNAYPMGDCLTPVTPVGWDAQPRPSGSLHGMTLPTSTCQTLSPESSNGGESDHYAYPRPRRREIVHHFRVARRRGEVQNKEGWAQANYSISGRTLLNYEREFPEKGHDS
jgi:hypothetical protein